MIAGLVLAVTALAVERDRSFRKVLSALAVAQLGAILLSARRGTPNYAIVAMGLTGAVGALAAWALHRRWQARAPLRAGAIATAIAVVLYATHAQAGVVLQLARTRDQHLEAFHAIQRHSTDTNVAVAYGAPSQVQALMFGDVYTQETYRHAIGEIYPNSLAYDPFGGKFYSAGDVVLRLARDGQIHVLVALGAVDGPHHDRLRSRCGAAQLRFGNQVVALYEVPYACLLTQVY